MSTTANYAATLKNSLAQLSVANANRDGTGTLVPLMFGGPSGSRIDRMQFEASGVTTAGMIRLFKTKGFAGGAIASLTASTTTVTVNTVAAHGRSNGEKVYMADAFPAEYNVMGATITVISATSFTYTVPTAPTVVTANISSAYYMTTLATPVTALWKEIAVSAVASPSASVPTWSSFMSSISDPGYFPEQVAAGWLIQASTANAETFNVHCDYGNY